MILAGDIGGTWTRLALFDTTSGRPDPVAQGRFPSRGRGGLAAIAGRFISTHGHRVTRACFGIAGPVVQGRVRGTNLPRVLDERELARALGIEAVTLINDLEATAHGLDALEPEDFATLNPGARGAGGNRAIIAAGTGLGEAGLYWDGSKHHPFATEGGHVDFAPRGELEIELLRYLLRELDRVSVERVVSGQGRAIHGGLRRQGQARVDPRGHSRAGRPERHGGATRRGALRHAGRDPFAGGPP